MLIMLQRLREVADASLGAAKVCELSASADSHTYKDCPCRVCECSRLLRRVYAELYTLEASVLDKELI